MNEGTGLHLCLLSCQTQARFSLSHLPVEIAGVVTAGSSFRAREEHVKRAQLVQGQLPPLGRQTAQQNVSHPDHCVVRALGRGLGVSPQAHLNIHALLEREKSGVFLHTSFCVCPLISSFPLFPEMGWFSR